LGLDFPVSCSRSHTFGGVAINGRSRPHHARRRSQPPTPRRLTAQKRDCTRALLVS